MSCFFFCLMNNHDSTFLKHRKTDRNSTYRQLCELEMLHGKQLYKFLVDESENDLPMGEKQSNVFDRCFPSWKKISPPEVANV